MANLFLFFSIVKLILSSFQWYITWTYSISVNKKYYSIFASYFSRILPCGRFFFFDDPSLTFNRKLGQNGYRLKICMSTKKVVRNSKSFVSISDSFIFLLFFQIVYFFSVGPSDFLNFFFGDKDFFMVWDMLFQKINLIFAEHLVLTFYRGIKDWSYSIFFALFNLFQANSLKNKIIAMQCLLFSLKEILLLIVQKLLIFMR